MKYDIYLSGPMTGLPEYNYPAFFSAAWQLRNGGKTVFSPAENGLPTSAPWEQHMRVNIAALTKCAAVATLPGWQQSRGAKLELRIARMLGMAVLEFDAAEKGVPA